MMRGFDHTTQDSGIEPELRNRHPDVSTNRTWVRKVPADLRHLPFPNWSLLRARTAYWTWQLVTKVGMAPLYIALIADGFRNLIPPLGLKLSKLPLPFISMLDDFEGLHRLDLAIVFAVFMMMAAWTLWGKMLWLYLQEDDQFDDHGWDATKHRRLVVGLGWAILIADICLFYLSMTQVTWAGTAFSFTALLATAAYVSLVIFMAYVANTLKKNIHDRKQETP